jgi:hypothetical protein
LRACHSGTPALGERVETERRVLAIQEEEETMSRQVKYVGFMAAGMLAVAVGYAGASEDEGGRHFKARLHGFQEPPSVSSTGRGTFEARLDDENDLIFYKLTYEALEGPATIQAHIHLGQRSVNGGVAVFLCGGAPPSSDKPACPPVEGTVEGVIDPADIIGPAGQGLAPGEWEEFIRALRAGMTYANIHTTKHPGGEIRGQINDSDRDDRHR